MATLREIWYDIKRDLKQSKDDPEIPDAQGYYWTLVVADRLRMQHIVKRRSGAFLQRFVLQVLVDEVFQHRCYVVLPRSIYDIDLDAGVHELSFYKPAALGPDFGRITFARTSPAGLRSRQWCAYQQSSGEHPWFWREGNRLYLDGIKADLVPYIEAHLYTTLPTLDEVDALNLLDVQLDFPAELIFPLKRAIIDMGRFAMSLPGQYLRNDGTNRPEGRVLGAPEKTLSVNDPLVNSSAD